MSSRPTVADTNTADKPSRLLLQSVTFGKPDRRQRQDEERHEPIVSKRLSEQVDDPGRPLTSQSSPVPVNSAQIPSALKSGIPAKRPVTSAAARTTNRRSPAEDEAPQHQNDARQPQQILNHYV
jgi:hypothetical protein